MLLFVIDKGHRRFTRVKWCQDKGSHTKKNSHSIQTIHWNLWYIYVMILKWMGELFPIILFVCAPFLLVNSFSVGFSFRHNVLSARFLFHISSQPFRVVHDLCGYISESLLTKYQCHKKKTESIIYSYILFDQFITNRLSIFLCITLKWTENGIIGYHFVTN